MSFPIRFFAARQQLGANAVQGIGTQLWIAESPWRSRLGSGAHCTLNLPGVCLGIPPDFVRQV